MKKMLGGVVLSTIAAALLGLGIAAPAQAVYREAVLYNLDNCSGSQWVRTYYGNYSYHDLSDSEDYYTNGGYIMDSVNSVYVFPGSESITLWTDHHLTGYSQTLGSGCTNRVYYVNQASSHYFS